MVIKPRAIQWNTSQFMLFVLAVFYLALPSYFAFEPVASLPSFSASRIIILVATLAALLGRKKILIPRNSPIMMIVIVWAVLTIILNLLHLSDSFSYATKEIFSVFLERLLLVLVICTYVNTNKKIDTFLHYMVVTSMVLAILGIVEFLTGYNVFTLLETSSRDFLQSSYERAGMHRTASSFGHAVYYSLYCTCMLPFSFYLYEKTRKRLYLACSVFNIIGILISGTRGQLIPLLFVIFFYVAFADKSVRYRYIRTLTITFFVVLIICLAVPVIRNYLYQNFLSLLNELGFKVNISDYGENTHGISSRIIQFSGVRWLIINKHFWTGLGPVPAYRELVSYYYPNQGWVTTRSIDVGYMSWFLSNGLIGFLNNSLMMVTILYYSRKYAKRLNYRTNTLEFAFLVFIVIYLISLFNSSGNGDILWIVIALMVEHQRSLLNHEGKLIETGPAETALATKKPKTVRVKVRRKR